MHYHVRGEGSQLEGVVTAWLAVAPVTAHTTGMNLTILLEAGSSLALLFYVARSVLLMTARRSQVPR